MDVDPAESLTALLERARAAMSGAAVVVADPGPTEGSAADGLITAEASAEGRLCRVSADPRLLRLPLEEICAQLVLAVNAALDAQPGRADAGPLLAELQAVQEQSVTVMAQLSAAFTDALAKATGR